MTACHDCPRKCGAARTIHEPGWCGVDTPPGFLRLGKIMAHYGEEPFISGTKGSGAVFFSGCALGCLFCQNYRISHPDKTLNQIKSSNFRGTLLSCDELVSAIEELADQGVHNINWVTASHYTTEVIAMISKLRNRGLTIPMIWNSSAYENVEMVRRLENSIQIYLPDFKYFESSLSAGLAHAPNYAHIAGQAILEMYRQQPIARFDDTGILLQGLVLRHLVLPGHYKDSIPIIDFIAANFPSDIPFSLMNQYTPFPELEDNLKDYPELQRKLTTYEYNKTLEYAYKRGLSRVLTQKRSAATAAWTPDF